MLRRKSGHDNRQVLFEILRLHSQSFWHTQKDIWSSPHLLRHGKSACRTHKEVKQDENHPKYLTGQAQTCWYAFDTVLPGIPPDYGRPVK